MIFNSKIMLFSFALAINTLFAECDVKYSNNIVHYADEYNLQNRIITVDYKDMEILDLKNIDGNTNHHADPMGTLNGTNYMMLVPKGSYFVHFYDVKNGNFIKKIRLPFKPRSADAYNKKYNLVFLNARNRPAGVLIDTKKLKIVGKIGFNIKCNTTQPKPLRKYKIYDNEENFNKDYQCLAVDFGGDQISGHPIWLNSQSLALIDRANRVIHVYKIKPNKDGTFSTKKIQTIKTKTSLHQLIAHSNRDDNTIFYGMTEGNSVENLAAGVYKFKLKKNKLKRVAYTKLRDNKIFGTNGHNLYITPDKKYLYAPVGALLERSRSRFNITNKRKKIESNYKKHVKMFLRENINDQELNDHKKIQKLFKKFSKINCYTPKDIVSKDEYIAKNILKPSFNLLPNGSVYIIDTKSMKVVKRVKAGKGAGHVAFSKELGLAVVTNHLDDFLTIIDYKKQKFIKNLNLNFEHQNIFNLSQSHMQYISSDGEYYYNFWSDGGVFFRVNLDTLSVDRNIYVGGIPIQGNFYKDINKSCDTNSISLEDGYDRFFEEDNVMELFNSNTKE